MHVGQEIIIGGGRMMKKVTVRLIKKDGRIGVDFKGAFFVKDDKVKLVYDGKKVPATVKLVSGQKSILIIPSTVQARAWGRVKENII